MAGTTNHHYGRYTHAIVCRIPNSWVKASGSKEVLDLEEARREHQQYTNVLRNLGLDVIELPADENFPESCYVEDTVVVVNGLALICRPGHQTRAKEVDIMRSIIKKELNLPTVEISDPKATIDGGDVLWTGREFFVGLSKRTNEAGARAVAAAFPEFPVTPIRVPNKLLHLKSAMSMAGPDILCISSTPEAQEMLKRIEREATYRYNTLTVPENNGANTLFINGTLVHRSEYPQCTEIFEKKIDYPRLAIKGWELSKPQAYLTCLSILVRKSKHIRI